MTRSSPIVLKFGGELLDAPSRLANVVLALANVLRTGATAPGAGAASGPVELVIVHGGGKEIDRALTAAGIKAGQVDGLRITDAPTLDVVVSVVAGTVNTRFVAALTTAGVPAVGLTGADAACGLCDEAPQHRAADGRTVDLGLVGVPSDRSETRLVAMLAGAGFVPVIACIGLGDDGRLFNVNADTLAAHLAARLGATRLVIAGTTAGVLDDRGATLGVLDPAAIERLIDGGGATAGMVAKLRGCAHALAGGVGDVVIVDGRDRSALEAAALGKTPPNATRLVSAAREPGRTALQGNLR
jgi:acetylglutamate kinase